MNHEVQSIKIMEKSIEIGNSIHEYFEENLERKIEKVMNSNQKGKLLDCDFDGTRYHLDLVSLSGRFQGKGVIVVFNNPK